MSIQEVKDRLDRIKHYNLAQRKEGQTHHLVTRRMLRLFLVEWGHSPDLEAGIGFVPPPSPFLKEESVGTF